jgi:hypothetical protein
MKVPARRSGGALSEATLHGNAGLNTGTLALHPSRAR